MVGVGYPSRGLVYANLGIARGTEQREVIRHTESGRPLNYRPLKTSKKLCVQKHSNNYLENHLHGRLHTFFFCYVQRNTTAYS